MMEDFTMPRFIVRPGGSREYLPEEYRGAPQDYYASRIREAMRNRGSSLQMKRAKVARLERDLLLDRELARVRAKYRQLVNKTRLLKRNDGIQIAEKPPMRFAPRF